MDNKKLSSLEVYSVYQKKISKERTNSQRSYANDVLLTLWEEINDDHKKISEIDFFVAVSKMITKAKQHRVIDESKISLLDAGIFTNALYSCLKNNTYSESAISDEYLPNMFKRSGVEYNKAINILERVNINVNKIEKMVEEMTFDYEQQTVMQGNNSTVSECEDNSEELRHRVNEKAVENWHNEMEYIDSTLKGLQPDVKKILEQIIGFSDKLTDDYVLKFAGKQIELYDYIMDTYLYHKNKIESSDNPDYINAVMNYEDFLDTIIDNLAVFGIEEICSNSGDYFDGKIHESESRDFSSHNAIIKKSIRSGFKYNDIVIQKEKVEV